jgi:hypothetical protein
MRARVIRCLYSTVRTCRVPARSCDEGLGVRMCMHVGRQPSACLCVLCVGPVVHPSVFPLYVNQHSSNHASVQRRHYCSFCLLNRRLLLVLLVVVTQ